MNFLKKLIKKEKQTLSSGDEEQAVLVYIRLSDEQWGSQQDVQAVFDLEDRLREVIERQQLGEYDGNEIGEGFGRLFMYASDADCLFSGIEATLKAFESVNSMVVVKRYGKPGAREVIIRYDGMN
jgi:hypothetical protein